MNKRIRKKKIDRMFRWCYSQEVWRGEVYRRRKERLRAKRWKPTVCEWEDMFDGCRDVIIPHAYPVCPRCREPLYEAKRCVFCGQVIKMDDVLREWLEPEEEQRMDCFVCGAKDALLYTRSKVNGHIRGTCSACGAMVIE